MGSSRCRANIYVLLAVDVGGAGYVRIYASPGMVPVLRVRIYACRPCNYLCVAAMGVGRVSIYALGGSYAVPVMIKDLCIEGSVVMAPPVAQEFMH